MPTIYEMTVPQIIARGWSIITDNKTGVATAIRSTIPDWMELTWAQQTYYMGKYRFSGRGILEISLSEIRSSTEKDIWYFVRDIIRDQHVTPDGALAGSNDRLREILERSRVNLERRGYDDSALLHIGSDGSAIYTNEAGWGPPLYWPHEFYAELDDFRTCRWEIGPSWVPEVPGWACPLVTGSSSSYLDH